MGILNSGWTSKRNFSSTKCVHGKHDTTCEICREEKADEWKKNERHRKEKIEEEWADAVPLLESSVSEVYKEIDQGTYAWVPVVDAAKYCRDAVFYKGKVYKFKGSSQTMEHRLKNEKILNLTQHKASAEQVRAGVVNFDSRKNQLKKYLTFEKLPDPHLVQLRAVLIAEMATEAGVKKAMIGGAPFLMPELEKELRAVGITPLYAFSRREVVEEGGKKTAIFKHLGFIEGTIKK